MVILILVLSVFFSDIFKDLGVRSGSRQISYASFHGDYFVFAILRACQIIYSHRTFQDLYQVQHLWKTAMIAVTTFTVGYDHIKANQ